MNWGRGSLIYCPTGDSDWRFQFAMLPTPLLIDPERLRIFLGFCDSEMRGRIGYVDVNPLDPSEVLEVSNDPLLDIGKKGCFDDNGVVPISVIRKEQYVYLYYIGFQLGKEVPYYMFCGLSVSTDNGHSFKRYSEVPILDRKDSELFARCGCFVRHDSQDCENPFKMWYVGSHGPGWAFDHQNKVLPLYKMKYICSNDGICWSKNESQTCLDFANEDEHGFGRPYVYIENDIYKMYYSIRTFSRGYYIGYAESHDGISWERMDQSCSIMTSNSGWDSENISYPVVVKIQNKTYMFYNGNGCGKSGFGYAELDE